MTTPASSLHTSLPRSTSSSRPARASPGTLACWQSLLESALVGDPSDSLQHLAERAGITLSALLRALSDPAKTERLSAISQPVLHFLRTLLAVRLFRRALESDDLAVAKLALSLLPPAPESPTAPLSWPELLSAIPDPSNAPGAAPISRDPPIP